MSMEIGNQGNQGIPQRPPCTHDESCSRDAKNMPGHRHRDKDGSLRAKRGDTHLDTLEIGKDKIGEFSNLPDDTHLSKLREMSGKKGVHAVAKELRKRVSTTTGVDVKA